MLQCNFGVNLHLYDSVVVKESWRVGSNKGVRDTSVCRQNIKSSSSSAK